MSGTNQNIIPVTGKSNSIPPFPLPELQPVPKDIDSIINKDNIIISNIEDE